MSLNAFRAFATAALLAGALSSLATAPHRIPDYIIAGICLLAAALTATLAEARAAGHGLRYRRWLHWHYVPYKDIHGFGRAFAWYYIRLPKAARPWGVVFVAPPPSFRVPNPQITSIRRGLGPGRGPVAPRPAPQSRQPWRVAVAFAAVGAAVTAIAVFLTPSDVLMRFLLLPGTDLPQVHLIVVGEPIFWGAAGVVFFVLALRGRRPRLFGLFSGLTLAWFAIVAPMLLR